jgi:hypothetical protein
MSSSGRITCNFDDRPTPIEDRVAKADTVLVGRVLLAWGRDRDLSQFGLKEVRRYRNEGQDVALISVDRYLKGGDEGWRSLWM